MAAARELLGVPYRLGGRMRAAGDGVDCQGVLFYAAERIGRCGWKSFSVYSTVSVARGELGEPVEGLAPIAAERLEVSALREGDILLLVGHQRNPAEPAIGTLAHRPVWVWHTGVYSGGGKWIVGDHYAGEVIETDLGGYLAAHPLYAGVYVTRMARGPSPLRCRTHAPMRRQAP